MRPRREQTVVSVRSDKLAARLKLLTRDGRSQAEILEDAIDKVPTTLRADDIEARRARIEALIDRLAETDIPSMAEFDAEEYDEFGNPR